MLILAAVIVVYIQHCMNVSVGGSNCCGSSSYNKEMEAAREELCKSNYTNGTTSLKGNKLLKRTLIRVPTVSSK